MKDRAAAMARKNEERRMKEEMKAAELAAQQQLDAQIAKEEFEKHLEEMERLKQAQVGDRGVLLLDWTDTEDTIIVLVVVHFLTNSFL